MLGSGMGLGWGLSYASLASPAPEGVDTHKPSAQVRGGKGSTATAATPPPPLGPLGKTFPTPAWRTPSKKLMTTTRMMRSMT